MTKNEGDIKSKEGDLESKRVELLKQKSGRLKCPVCGAPVRVRLSDGAAVCREGGHVTYIDGRVTLHGGVETSLKELREKKVIE